MKLIGFLVLATVAAVACGTSSAGPGDDKKPGGDGPKASDQEIAACKQSCDQLKFFDCNDSVDQATCYHDCAGATSDQIELFTACVTNDTCDATCSTHIQPAPDPSTSGGSASANTTGDTCASDGCATGGDPVGAACKAACDKLQFFDCIDGETFGTCSSLCMSAETTKKETFAACVESGSIDQCQAIDCYYQFDPSAVPGPTPKQIADCKMSCEQLGFFDCLTGAEAAQCAAACDASTKEEIEAFLICTADPTDCSGVASCL